MTDAAPADPIVWSRDLVTLFAARCLRMFAYGFVALVLALYLKAMGKSEWQIGLIITLTLVGDAVISLWLTTRADRLGRRRMLVIGAVLMIASAAAFASTDWMWLLVLAGTVGVISPSGNEIGPFMPIEQAALAQLIPPARRTGMLAWYNVAGSMATAAGALAGGLGVALLQRQGWSDIASYRVVIAGYGVVGVALGVLQAALSSRVEAPPRSPSPARPDTTLASTSAGPRVLNYHADDDRRNSWGLRPDSNRRVWAMSALFSVDAFAGGFVINSMVILYFVNTYNMSEAWLGGMIAVCNVVAGLSALVAAPLSKKIGLVNTMVFTHLPSNVLLMLVPFMPSAPWAVGMLIARFCISQMDVPPRQALVMAVVPPDERSAAGGITNIARTTGSSISPAIAGLLGATPIIFLLGGGLKIVYDLAFLASFRRLNPKH